MPADFGNLALRQVAELVRSFGDDAKGIAADALNHGAEFGRSAAVTKIHRELNLDLGYIDQRLKVSTKADAARLRSVISAGRRRGSTHRAYGAKYINKPAKSSLRRLTGRRLGNVPRGKKAAGLGGYRVKRGGKMLRFPNGFLIEGRNNNIITVRRTGKGRNDLQTLYGPSVSQAFDAVRDDISPVIESVMTERIQQKLSELIR